MSKSDLKNKSRHELESTLVELRSRISQLNFERLAKKVKNSSEFIKTRRAIARVLTQLRVTYS